MYANDKKGILDAADDFTKLAEQLREREVKRHITELRARFENGQLRIACIGNPLEIKGVICSVLGKEFQANQEEWCFRFDTDSVEHILVPIKPGTWMRGFIQNDLADWQKLCDTEAVILVQNADFPMNEELFSLRLRDLVGDYRCFPIHFPLEKGKTEEIRNAIWTLHLNREFILGQKILFQISRRYNQFQRAVEGDLHGFESFSSEIVPLFKDVRSELKEQISHIDERLSFKCHRYFPQDAIRSRLIREISKKVRSGGTISLKDLNLKISEVNEELFKEWVTLFKNIIEKYIDGFLNHINAAVARLKEQLPSIDGFQFTAEASDIKALESLEQIGVQTEKLETLDEFKNYFLASDGVTPFWGQLKERPYPALETFNVAGMRIEKSDIVAESIGEAEVITSGIIAAASFLPIAPIAPALIVAAIILTAFSAREEIEARETEVATEEIDKELAVFAHEISVLTEEYFYELKRAAARWSKVCLDQLYTYAQQTDSRTQQYPPTKFSKGKLEEIKESINNNTKFVEDLRREQMLSYLMELVRSKELAAKLLTNSQLYENLIGGVYTNIQIRLEELRFPDVYSPEVAEIQQRIISNSAAIDDFMALAIATLKALPGDAHQDIMHTLMVLQGLRNLKQL